MKKFLLIILILTAGINAEGKTTYIPTYVNKLFIIDERRMDSITNYQRILEYNTDDGLVSFSILQQCVTPELVKEIKRMKRAEGWASVAAGFSAFSAGLSQGQLYSGRVNGYTVRNYIESSNTMNNAISLAESAHENSRELMDLLVDVMIRNNSEKEILISDMDKGFTWFVMPKSDIVLSLQKDETTSLRVSSVNPLDEKVRYVNMLSANKMKKYDVSLETDDYWYLENISSARRAFRYYEKKEGGYLKINKESMSVEEFISEEEFKVIKKESSK